MTRPDSIHVAGGVRKYMRRSIAQRIVQAASTRKLGACGDQVFIERGVQFLRHPDRIDLGSHVIVKEGARLCPANADASISIGAWTTVGYHTHIFATQRISVGADTLIAPFCYLVDSNHGIARGALIREQLMTSAPIQIGSDVWLGTGVVVLAGVTIGDGAVVAAGAVVSADIPDYCIAAGNPAHPVDERK